jgi:predicted nuclease with RNAse H fold
VTAPADKPEFIEFDIPLSEIQRNPFRKLETTFPQAATSFFISGTNRSARGGKDPLQVVIDYIEVSAPHFDRMAAARVIWRYLPPSDKNKSDEQAYGREVLSRFPGASLAAFASQPRRSRSLSWSLFSQVST